MRIENGAGPAGEEELRQGAEGMGSVLNIVKYCGELLMCWKKCVLLQSQILGGRLWRALRLFPMNFRAYTIGTKLKRKDKI